MGSSDVFFSELRSLNHSWRSSRRSSNGSKLNFPKNLEESPQDLLDETITLNRPISKYRFWEEYQEITDSVYSDSDELKHQKSIPWSEMTDEQREMKRKEWKAEEQFYHLRLPIDPIRKAFIDDWRNLKSGVEIWFPR